MFSAGRDPMTPKAIPFFPSPGPKMFVFPGGMFGNRCTAPVFTFTILAQFFVGQPILTARERLASGLFFKKKERAVLLGRSKKVSLFTEKTL
jgi:hypothetical protein